MTIDWLPSVHALELYGVLALAGTCLLYTFVLHMGIRAMLRRAGQDRQFLRNRLAELAESMERLRAEHEEAARPPAVPTNGQPLNLNKRGQVLRMRRRGENPETIAAALSIPRNEVDLLLKVHQMSLEQLEKSPAQVAG